MYILFREFHWKPSDFYLMTEGEKIVVRGFLAKLLEEKEKEAREIDRQRKKGRVKR